MMKDTANLLELLEKARQFLLEREMKVCTAESCTGGYLAQMLTHLPGSSAWFDCGLVTYSNEAKTRLLGVPVALIDAHGAVSEAVAIGMAQGALDVSCADLAISITGIAGPSGAAPGKPVGTVWMASQLRGYEAMTRCEYFQGDRQNVRSLAVASALKMIMQVPFLE